MIEKLLDEPYWEELPELVKNRLQGRMVRFEAGLGSKTPGHSEMIFSELFLNPFFEESDFFPKTNILQGYGFWSPDKLSNHFMNILPSLQSFLHSEVGDIVHHFYTEQDDAESFLKDITIQNLNHLFLFVKYGETYLFTYPLEPKTFSKFLEQHSLLD